MLSNDTDAESDPLTAALVSDVSNGMLTLNSDGSFTYTPDLNFNGADSFTYMANDGTADSNIATVSITIEPINDAPVANNDNITTQEDTAVAVTLTASDVDGDALTYSVVSGPSNGSLSGTVPNLTYTPNPNFNGADSFTYMANDGTADSGVATVSSTVNANLHVGDIDGSKEKYQGQWKASANFTIHDSNHTPVSGAIVNYTWSSPELSGLGACTTGGAGQCPSEWTPYLKNRTKSVTFMVSNVAPSAWYWAPDNHDPGGDSDGTTITIVKP